MKNRVLLLFLAILLTNSLRAEEGIQSRFLGPVRLAVWQHWQPSWNAERDLGFPAKFHLVRGRNVYGVGYATLIYMGPETNLRVRFSGRAFFRKDQYSDEERDIAPIEIPGTFGNGGIQFVLGDDRFLDIPGKQIVTKISFDILQGEKSIFRYDLLPMFVRGSRNYHWSAEIDPYMAHAGSGSISVSNGTSSETNTDFWNGTPVRPSLQFIDHNVIKQGSVIGLHRHERNQEMWLVESGMIKVTHGMASIVSQPTTVTRKWNSAGETRQVAQFHAEGGWIEERNLGAGEYAVIVPNPNDTGNVCVHALEALSNIRTFTMGQKN